MFRAWRGELVILRFLSRYTLISFLVRWFSVGLFTSFDFYIARIGYGLSCRCWEEEEGLELVRFLSMDPHLSRKCYVHIV